jgi:hypothetical protein
MLVKKDFGRRRSWPVIIRRDLGKQRVGSFGIAGGPAGDNHTEWLSNTSLNLYHYTNLVSELLSWYQKNYPLLICSIRTGEENRAF